MWKEHSVINHWISNMIGQCVIRYQYKNQHKLWLHELWILFLLPTARIISVSLISWHSIVPLRFIYFKPIVMQFHNMLCPNDKKKYQNEFSTKCGGKAVTLLRKSRRVNVYFKNGFKCHFNVFLFAHPVSCGRVYACHFALCQQSVWIVAWNLFHIIMSSAMVFVCWSQSIIPKS